MHCKCRREEENLATSNLVNPSFGSKPTQSIWILQIHTWERTQNRQGDTEANDGWQMYPGKELYKMCTWEGTPASWEWMHRFQCLIASSETQETWVSCFFISGRQMRQMCTSTMNRTGDQQRPLFAASGSSILALPLTCIEALATLWKRW